MSRPGNEAPNPVKPPAKPVPQPAGGIDPTLAATGVFRSGIHAPSDPALQATMAFTPTEFSSAANDATLEVTNLVHQYITKSALSGTSGQAPRRACT